MNESNKAGESPPAPSAAESREPARPRSGFCCGCLVATAVLSVIFGLLLAMLFSSPGEIAERATRSFGSKNTVEQAATQFTEAQMRAMHGVKPTVQIQLSDADINAYLRQHRDELNLPSGLEDPQIAFGEGFIEGSVRTKVGFVPVRIRIKLVPKVLDGKLVFDVVKVKAGKIGVTGIMRGRLLKTISQLIQQRLDQSGVTIQSVVVRPGVMTITSVLDPTSAGGD